jgi:hypothetical protein
MLRRENKPVGVSKEKKLKETRSATGLVYILLEFRAGEAD